MKTNSFEIAQKQLDACLSATPTTCPPGFARQGRLGGLVWQAGANLIVVLPALTKSS